MKPYHVLLAVTTLAFGCFNQARGELLVASTYNDQILRFDGFSGGYLGVFANHIHPLDIKPDADGNIWVSSQPTDFTSALTKYNPITGQILASYTYSGQEAATSELTIGPNGDIYVTDFFEDRVARYSSTNGAYLGDFITPGLGGLNGPTGLTFGPDGDFYVSSRITGKVLRYNGNDGAFLGLFASPGGNGPDDIQFRPDGNLYVAVSGTQSILRFAGGSGASMGIYAHTKGYMQDGATMLFDSAGALYVNTYFQDSFPPSGYPSGYTVEKFLPGDLLSNFLVTPGSPGSNALDYPVGMYFTTPVPEPTSLTLLIFGISAIRIRSRN
jgi:DNA-binding beta-propeller fold protein YncE